MSVTNVIVANTGLSGETKGSDAASATRGHRVTLRVDCATGDTWDIIDVHFRSNSSLPYPGRIFDIGNGRDTRSRCTHLRGTQVANGEGRWLVEATFEETPSGVSGLPGTDGKPSDDPDKWHDKLEISSTQISIGVESALYLGNTSGARGPFIFPNNWYPPCNSAGKPYDPGIEEELDITVVRLTKFQPVYNTDFYIRYINTVNSANFVINKPFYRFRATVGRRTAKMKAINSTFDITEKGKKYWAHTLEIHINPMTWLRWLLDRGTVERFKSGDTDRKGVLLTASNAPLGFRDDYILDKEGNPVNEPVMFDGKGKMQVKMNPTPVYNAFQTLRETDWSGIQW